MIVQNCEKPVKFGMLNDMYKEIENLKFYEFSIFKTIFICIFNKTLISICRDTYFTDIVKLGIFSHWNDVAKTNGAIQKPIGQTKSKMAAKTGKKS